MSDSQFLRADPNPKPVDVLSQPDFDVREYRTDADINNIADSLANKGQVMPVLIGQQQGDTYPVLDGNHRVLAAKRLGWNRVDCIQTRAGADEDEVQIIANISRLELSPSEKLATFDYMLSSLDMSVAESAEKVGIDRSQAHRYKTVLTGFGEIKQFYMEGEIGVNACYELNQVEDRDRAVDIAETAVREGYMDKDVVQQARYARGDDDGEDEMRGAGTEQNTQNIQQVRKNAEAIGELDPVDSQAIDDAQVGAEGEQAPTEGQPTSPQQQAPQGPPCQACGKPMDSGGLTNIQFHPELAQKLGVEEIHLGAQCTGKLIEWWEQRQQNVETDDGDGEEDAA